MAISRSVTEGNHRKGETSLTPNHENEEPGSADVPVGIRADEFKEVPLVAEVSLVAYILLSNLTKPLEAPTSHQHSGLK